VERVDIGALFKNRLDCEAPYECAMLAVGAATTVFVETSAYLSGIGDAETQQKIRPKTLANYNEGRLALALEFTLYDAQLIDFNYPTVAAAELAAIPQTERSNVEGGVKSSVFAALVKPLIAALKLVHTQFHPNGASAGGPTTFTRDQVFAIIAAAGLNPLERPHSVVAAKLMTKAQQFIDRVDSAKNAMATHLLTLGGGGGSAALTKLNLEYCSLYLSSLESIKQLQVSIQKVTRQFRADNAARDLHRLLAPQTKPDAKLWAYSTQLSFLRRMM
jgi:hypothetical protein